MRIFFVMLLLVLSAVPVFAGSCSDTQSAASTAIKERNAAVKEIHNTAMPDPEEDRGRSPVAWAVWPALETPSPSA